MTQITLEKTDMDTDITVIGHCNAGRINGFDLCCCAVSMLVFTLMDSLSKLMLRDFHSDYSGGWCHIRFGTDSEDAGKAGTVIDTVFNGFRLLEERFPSSIAMNISEKITERRDENE